jgi:hypothetical protein
MHAAKQSEGLKEFYQITDDFHLFFGAAELAPKGTQGEAPTHF